MGISRFPSEMEGQNISLQLDTNVYCCSLSAAQVVFHLKDYGNLFLLHPCFLQKRANMKEEKREKKEKFKTICIAD
jgi:hypothetical protein